MRGLRLVFGLLIAVASGLPAGAASWESTRSQIMSLREAGRAGEAYALAAATVPDRAEDRSDRDFIAGYLAFRHMGSSDVAVGHFRSMIDVSTGIRRSSDQRSVRAKAGFWLAEILVSKGRSDDASRFYAASAAYRDTFYGMISATKAGLSDSPGLMEPLRARYPRPEIYWHDSRVREELVLAVIKAESDFRPTAQSGAGAKGLMQLMDGTAKDVGRKAGVAIDLALVAANGDYNVAVGSRHLAGLMERYGGNLVLSAAAYNAGEGRVSEWISRFGDPRSGISSVDWAEMIPFQETRDYVQKVSSNYFAYLALAAR